MVKHSMSPGVTEAMMQFETVRENKSSFVNLYQASVENDSTVIIGRKGVPIYHSWYDRFQVGMHHHMGYKVVRKLWWPC
jgi:hypothetical protein